MTMRGVLRSLSLAPGPLVAPSKRQRNAIAELARYVDYANIGGKKYSAAKLVKRLREFRSAVDKLFEDPIETLERNLGNAAPLAQNETSFVQRACHFSHLSRQLFGLLSDGIACSGAHEAQLHLSGFLAKDACFELHIADCAKQHWNLAQCRW